MDVFRQEYWRELPFPAPGYLPDPGIESKSLETLALAGRFFALCHLESSYTTVDFCQKTEKQEKVSTNS